MEKRNLILVLLFIAITVISILGFYKSYLSHLTDYGKFQTVIHLHFAAFICWFALIIVQPILIRKKKYQLHRQIGKASYFLVPILVATILILVYDKAQREILNSKSDASVSAFIGLLDAISLTVYYLIAMINRNNLRWHVAFIIAASLIILNPGMSRLLNHITMGFGMIAAVLVPFIVSISIIIFEKIRLKRSVLKSPYFLFFLCWTIEILLLITIPQTAFWQKLLTDFLT